MIFPVVLAAEPRFKSFFQIVLENTDYAVANQLPYMNSLNALGRAYTNMHGTSHNSQPNYVAMIAGKDFGLYTPEKIGISDSNFNFSDPTIADLLEAKGLTWKTYQENYPGNCFTAKDNGDSLYERKHNPFISSLSIQTNPARCANIVNADQLQADIAASKLPNYAMYVPNQVNDGHGIPPYPPTNQQNTIARVKVADDWLSKFLPPLLSNPAFKDTLFLVTFDENDVIFASGPFDPHGRENLIYTVAIGAGVQAGTTDNNYYDHYSQLALLEKEWGLGSLGANDVNATAFRL
ncbi:phosphoesterase, partial [Gorgonomyces haynaldii]